MATKKSIRRSKAGRVRRLSFVRRWHSARAPGAPSTPKKYIRSAELRVRINQSLGGKLAQQFSLRLADASYFCPPLKEAKEIIKASRVDRKNWVAERFDCDDFAHVLKAHFAEAAYKNGTRRAAHCFGIVWGSLPGPHAINWMVNDDLKLRFIEPQTDKVYFPKRTDKNIYFMLV